MTSSDLHSIQSSPAVCSLLPSVQKLLPRPNIEEVDCRVPDLLNFETHHMSTVMKIVMMLIEEERQILFKAEGEGSTAMGSCSGSDTLSSTPYSISSGGAQPSSRLGGQ